MQVIATFHEVLDVPHIGEVDLLSNKHIKSGHHNCLDCSMLYRARSTQPELKQRATVSGHRAAWPIPQPQIICSALLHD